jgi:Spy/CpxP family protein refolding chaperone
MTNHADDELGGRVSAALEETRPEPDVGFERRMREGAEASRLARRARRGAGVALALAGAAATLIWMLDRPRERIDLVVNEGGAPLVTPLAGTLPLSPVDAARVVAQVADDEAALRASADWDAATSPLAGDVDAAAIEDLARELALTPQQRQALRDVSDQASKEKVRARAEMEVLEIDLRRELDREAPDERKVAELIDKLVAAEGKTRKARILAALRVKKLLTDDQRAELEGGGRKRTPPPRDPARKPAPQREPLVDPFRSSSPDPAAPFSEKLAEAKRAYAGRHYQKALAVAEDALELSPGDQETMSIAAVTACKLHNVEVANKYLRRLRGQREAFVRQICLGEKVPLAEGPDVVETTGYLSVNTQPWARVVVDGKDTGMSTPIKNLELVPGRHVVTFVIGDKKFAHAIVIKAGEEHRLVKKLPVE